MTLLTAQRIILRRQAHLYSRVGLDKRDLTHDKREIAAINVVLMELKKLSMENDVLKGKLK
jgi:hypothetical protein